MRHLPLLLTVPLIASAPIAGQGGGTPGGGGTPAGPPVPTDPCSIPNAHYQGQPVELIESFIPLLLSSGVHLDAIGGPAGEFGIFLLSENAIQPVTVGQGLLCLTLPIARFNGSVAANTGNSAFDSLGQFDPAGSGIFLNLSGTASLSNGLGFDIPVDKPPPFGPGTFQPGETWWVQLWYRDLDASGNPSSNFSSAAEIEVP